MIDTAIPKRSGLSAGEIVTAYIGLLSTGKYDFGATENHWHNGLFSKALVILGGPAASSLRMQLDAQAEQIIPLTKRLWGNLVNESEATITQIANGKEPIAIDLFTLDYSRIQKERIGRLRGLLMYVSVTARANIYIFGTNPNGFVRLSVCR